MSSIVAIMRATTAGCWLRIEIDGNNPMLTYSLPVVLSTLFFLSDWNGKLSTWIKNCNMMPLKVARTEIAACEPL